MRADKGMVLITVGTRVMSARLGALFFGVNPFGSTPLELRIMCTRLHLRTHHLVNSVHSAYTNKKTERTLQ
jgi:hypothetical protein